ncbi:HdeD family acid-resistance protein [Mycolicibacterium sp.]|uniref:HdeD family acid-resistance protein n=1 Tax=Mycolicibacterium sp. TaxID=2320850 RepID=UPI001D48E70F|nr:HdeD family acid-resistance protein [Mycolicibacterium sp.]MCB1289989.1 HdeD family acid-resistance protein [Mycobacterium sp.]MCB9408101.1 HdeD family acid-resistance protein [Mycolicibacterium sp.]
MTTQTGGTLVPHLWKSVLLTGILSLILGVMVLVWPGPTLLVAAIFFGVYLLVTGVSQVFHAFTLHISGGGRALLFISGAASLVLAVLCFRSIGNSILLLAIWIGIGFIFRGVATAAAAISDSSTPSRGWEIFIGIVTLIAGVIVLAYPFESLPTLIWVTGIWLVVIGVMEIIASFGIRKAGNEVRTAVGEALGTR